MALDFSLPNIREMFIPDPGFIIGDVDLDRADAQVVAWESDEPLLKQALKRGVDLHLLNSYAISGETAPELEVLIEGHPDYQKILKERKLLRVRAKAWCHGTNYGGSARTMAINTGITTKESEAAQENYFGMFPGIKRWHRRVEAQLQTTRTVSNKFGYRRPYFDRVEGLLPEALAWIPQSTVGLVINEAWENIHRELKEIQVLLQVHDSLVLQFRREHYKEILPKLHSAMLITVPYEDPLIIPAGIKLSLQSWASCKAHPWEAVVNSPLMN